MSRFYQDHEENEIGNFQGAGKAMTSMIFCFYCLTSYCSFCARNDNRNLLRILYMC
jgi:hypothetical protein